MSERPDHAPPRGASGATGKRQASPYPRYGFTRALRGALIATWAILGWYAGSVVWALVARFITVGTPSASVRDVLSTLFLPGRLAGPQTPPWAGALFGIVMVVILGGGIWASRDLGRELATLDRGRESRIVLPWLAPLVAGLVVTLGTQIVTAGRGLAGVPAAVRGMPPLVEDGTLAAAFAILAGITVAVIRELRRRRREPRSVTKALEVELQRRQLPVLLSVVADDWLREYLAAAQNDPTYFTEALKRLRSQIEFARTKILYPEQDTLFASSAPPASDLSPSSEQDAPRSNSAPSAPPASDASAPPAIRHLPDGRLDPAQSPPQALADCYITGDIADGWFLLVGDAMLLVSQLAGAYDTLGIPQTGRRAVSPGPVGTRRLRASEVVRALRLLLLAQLYALRADVNKESNDPRSQQRLYQWPSQVLKAITRMRHTYDRLAGLRVLRTALPAGWKEGDDATEYSAWSRPFGTAREGEVGWSPFARTVGYELRYQQHKVELRQRWSEIRAAAPSLLNPLRVLGAAALWLFKATTGFGFKPRRLAWTALGVVAVFSVAYYADEVTSACKDGARSLADFPREIVYAIGNLTNLGAAEPCGPTRGVLTSIESVIGIFMLSVLAAMLFAWLTDR